MFLSASQVADYHRDGYVVLPGALRPREVELLLGYVDLGDAKGSKFADQGGRTSRLKFWSDLEGHIWGAASMCPRIINNVRILLGEEAAFFHGKVTLKEARTGGAWEWHQDFGYWYDQGFVFPRMISVAVALDRNTRANGCMRLLRGSHLLGRLNHVHVGSQYGVEAERMKGILPLFEEVAAELAPGDALFFHNNTLHVSAPNESDQHRRNFIMCYNALGNPQLGTQKTFQQFPCPVAPDDVIERFPAAPSA